MKNTSALTLLAVALVALAVIFSPGCTSQVTKQHVDTLEKSHDRACDLIAATVSGTLTGDDAKWNLQPGDLEATPPRVRALLGVTTLFIYESRKNAHTLSFTLGDGPDPATLTFSDPPAAIVSGL